MSVTGVAGDSVRARAVDRVALSRKPLREARPETPATGWYARRGKRALDVVLGVLLAILAVPIIAVLASITVVVLRTWPFFSQPRVGMDGRRFRFLKIRTLPVRAPRAADKYATAKIPIPRFCSALRRWHLDELPQLLLVPLGTMSLVGPRPEMPELLPRYAPEFAAERARLRPGCTGPWQISVDSDTLICESPQYDELYVRNVGLKLDLWVLWRTFCRLFAPERASISLADLRVRCAAHDEPVDLEPEIDLPALHAEEDAEAARSVR
jgi:lipopolysaccharide/colanic/teichoic acid biosynthesis glycosyltransferase